MLKTNKQVLDMADGFNGTAYVGFEAGNKLLMIGRIKESEDISLYERDYKSEAQGGKRVVLATFDGPEEAARAAAIIDYIGQAIP